MCVCMCAVCTQLHMWYGEDAFLALSTTPSMVVYNYSTDYRQCGMIRNMFLQRPVPSLLEFCGGVKG